MMDFKIVQMEMPENSNIILGQSHFIKTVEDIYEALASSAAGIRFGVAFCEASGERLVRVAGNDPALEESAAENAMKIGCGHSFTIVMRNAYPINVLTQLKTVPEICTIHAASANPLQVIVLETDQGRGFLGVVDGYKPMGVETEEGVRWRQDLLKKIGYKT